MTLGAGALARPLHVKDADQLHAPWLMMLAALALVIALTFRRHELARVEGIILLACYPIFVALVVFH
jgi:Ca2+/Na+ antiporter